MKVKVWKVILQIISLYLILLLGNEISKLLNLPIPGSIVGLVLLFISLELKVVKLEWIDLGASFLLSQLLLFFIPSAIGVMEYKSLFGVQGLKIVAVIILSSLVVMVCTGLSAEWVNKRKRGRHHESTSPRS